MTNCGRCGKPVPPEKEPYAGGAGVWCECATPQVVDFDAVGQLGIARFELAQANARIKILEIDINAKIVQLNDLVQDGRIKDTRIAELEKTHEDQVAAYDELDDETEKLANRISELERVIRLVSDAVERANLADALCAYPSISHSQPFK